MKRTTTKKRYLDVKAHKLYRVSGELLRSFEDGDNPATMCEPSEWNENVCKSCVPVLDKYATTFSCMKQQGPELKKHKL